MAISRPTEQTGGFTGYKSGTVTKFYDAAVAQPGSEGQDLSKHAGKDLRLVMEIESGGKFPDRVYITGNFTFDEHDDLDVSKMVIKNLYKVLDSIGCPIGLNSKGEWEDQAGKPIKDVYAYLTKFIAGRELKVYYYQYKQTNTETGKGYYKIYDNIVMDTVDNRTKLQKDVAYASTSHNGRPAWIQETYTPKGKSKAATKEVVEGVDDDDIPF